jgi:hypothetical protein
MRSASVAVIRSPENKYQILLGAREANQLWPHQRAAVTRDKAGVYMRITNPAALWDESLNFYPRLGGTPHLRMREWRWPHGGKIKFSHLQFETTVYDWQAAQITLICFDELTHFSAHQFFYMVSRGLISARPATRTPTPGSPTSFPGGSTRKAGIRSPSGPGCCAI